MSKINHLFTGILLVSTMGSAACSSMAPSEPTVPALAIRIEAPAHFRTWFAQTEACSGLVAEFETIEWYVVPGVNDFPVDGEPRVGMWQRVAGKSQIVVAGNYVDHEMVVSHEILHHLLGREGHPTAMFGERCHLTWDTWATKGGASVASGE